jgi:L-fuconolactonase
VTSDLRRADVLLRDLGWPTDMDFACIDAHQHLWRYLPSGPAWMADGMEALQRDFLLNDLRTVTAEAGVTGTIAVETERTTAETNWLSKVASSDDLICGVVGWAPLTTADVASELERIAALPKMKAVRHPIHDEPDDQFVLRDDFNRGIAELKRLDLGYDILIFEKHLPQTIQFVGRHPDQIFILDHVAKPRIRDRVLAPWQANIQELALRPNVYCKLSGMVTEARWKQWQPGDFRSYLDAVVEAFGPERVMIGSDWPVCTLSGDYASTMRVVIDYSRQFPAVVQDGILGENCARFYGIQPQP